MKTEKCKALLQRLVQQYQKIEDYFTSGSFGVKFYPFLMYPCVRHSQSFIVRLLAILSVFIGLYFLFAELIAILFSHVSLPAYIQHTLFELLLPAGTIIDDRVVQLSPLSFVVRASFLIQGYFFTVIYLFAIMRITQNVRLIAGLLALCFSCGMILIYSAQGGKFTEGGLQNIGLDITLLIGNLTLIITGLTVKSSKLNTFKHFSLIAGTIGATATTIPLIEPTIYLAALERIGLYCILSWEIVAGFTVLKKHKILNKAEI